MYHLLFHTHILSTLLIGINTLTPITFLKACFQDLSHIISFRRQAYIKFKNISRLPGSLLIHFEKASNRIFLTDDTLTCYLYKRTDHTLAYCKTTTEHNKTILMNQKSDTDNTTKINKINKINAHHENETSNPENNYNIAPVPVSPLEKNRFLSQLTQTKTTYNVIFKQQTPIMITTQPLLYI